jgi:hypothetical protein
MAKFSTSHGVIIISSLTHSLKKDLVYLVQEVWQALMEIFELIKLGPTTPTSIGTSSDQFPWDNTTHLLK